MSDVVIPFPSLLPVKSEIEAPDSPPRLPLRRGHTLECTRTRCSPDCAKQARWARFSSKMGGILSPFLMTISSSLLLFFSSSLALLSSSPFFSPVNAQFLRKDPQARCLAVYLMLKGALMTLQMLVGLWSHKLGLVSDSLHTLVDCIVLYCSLLALAVSQAKEMDGAYSYGLGRANVFAAFVTLLSVVFVCLFTIVEAFHSLPPTAVHNQAIPVALLSFSTNCIGMIFFYHFSQLNGSSSRHASPEDRGKLREAGRAMNMQGVFLHALNDCLSTAGLLFAFFFSHWRQWAWVYAFVYLMAALWMLSRCYPLLHSCLLILLQTTPQEVSLNLERCIREITFYDGVLECSQSHWWSLHPGNVVGTVNLRIRSDANEADILQYVRKLLSPFVTTLTVQLERDLAVSWVAKAEAASTS